MSTDVLTEGDLHSYAEAFANHLSVAIASLSGIDLVPAPFSNGELYSLGKTLQLSYPYTAMTSFSGGICGDYMISCEAREWENVFSELVSETEPFETLFISFLKECLNMAVGHAIDVLRPKFPNLTFISPKFLVGSLDYPATDTISLKLTGGPIQHFEIHLAINTMLHEVERALQKEHIERIEAQVRVALMKEMAEQLESEVSARTRELRAAKERTEAILRSLSEMLLTINRDLTVADEVSDSAKTFFGSRMIGRSLLDLFYPISKSSLQIERQSMEDFLGSAFDLLVPDQFSAMIGQAPQRLYFLREGERGKAFRFSLQYSPVIVEGQLEKIVISMRDDTIIGELKDAMGTSYKKMVSSLEHLQTLLDDEQNTQSLIAYLEDMVPLAESLNDGLKHFDEEKVEDLMRHTHTIKGGARTFKLEYIQYFAHEAESILTKLRKGQSSLTTSDFVTLSENVRMVIAGLKSLKKMFTKESPPDATSVWLSCVENLKRSARALAYDLQKDVDFEVDSEFMLYGKDLSIFNRILPHLLRNSIDHGLELPAERKLRGKRIQGKIHLHMELVDDLWQLSYKDDGRGVDIEKVRSKALRQGLIDQGEDLQSHEDILRILCHPGFSSLNEVTEISGRGVGMDAIKTLLEQSGGSLTLKDSSRTGTLFLMQWKPQEKNPMRQWASEAQEAILIVDDETENSEILVEIIRRETKRMILCARDGKEALQLLASESIGLVLTDINMPQMSGWQFLSELIKNYNSIPVIVMTGASEEETRRRIFNLGVTGFLDKPLDYQLLRSTIRQALSQRRRHAADEESKRRSLSREAAIKQSLQAS